MMGKRSLCVLIFWICVAGASGAGFAKEPISGVAQEAPNIGRLLQTLQETVTNVANPGRSEVARLINNSVRTSSFQNVWQKDKQVEGYIVHDNRNFIKGIYPSPPEIVHGGDLRVTRQVFTGTGRWYTPRAPTIGPKDPTAADSMRKWDSYLERKLDESMVKEAVSALGRVAAGQRDVSPGGPGQRRPGGVRIYFDDRILAKVLGRWDDAESGPRLQSLGSDLTLAGDEQQVEGILQGFINDTKARFVKETKPVSRLHGVLLVSLNQVLRRIGTVGQQGAALSEEVRSLGGLTRIHGYVRDPDSGDVVLVGRVDSGVRPIGLDNFLAALSSVWMKGATPEVSLDLDPTDPGGPQRVRVHGIPRDSRFARLMLDADYALKRIQGEDPAERVNILGYRSVRKLIAERPTEFRGSRFWLSPRPPGEGDIQISSDEDVVLFDTGVRVLTEEMRIVHGGGLVGTGGTARVSEEAARSFTEHYGEIERAKPIFVELHGLFDLVMLSKIWRQLRVQATVLERLASVPHAPEFVPESYPGVTFVVYAKDNRLHKVSGGVVIRSRFGRRHGLHYDDKVMENIRSLAKRLDGQQRMTYWAGNVAVDLVQPQESESDLEEGAEALARGDYGKALGALSRVIRRDEQFTDAYVMRALAREGLGDLKAALEDIDRALALEPKDADLVASRFILMMNMGVPVERIPGDEATKAEVANLYYQKMLALWELDRDTDAALAAADVILRLNSRHADAYILRAWLRLRKGDPKAALQDAEQALKLVPRFAQAFTIRGIARAALDDHEGAYDDFTAAIGLRPDVPEYYFNRGKVLEHLGNTRESQVDLSQSRLLEIDRYTQLLQKEPDNASLYLERAMVKVKSHQFRSGVADYTEAIKRNSRMVLAYKLRAEAYNRLEEYGSALSDSSKAIELDPQFAEAYAVRAVASSRLKRFDDAIRDCTKALQINPRLAYAYFVRGQVRLDRRDYEEAIRDLESGMQLEPWNKGLYQRLIDIARQRKEGR